MDLEFYKTTFGWAWNKSSTPHKVVIYSFILISMQSFETIGIKQIHYFSTINCLYDFHFREHRDAHITHCDTNNLVFFSVLLSNKGCPNIICWGFVAFLFLNFMVLYHRLQHVFGTNSHLCAIFQCNFLEAADTQVCKSVMFVFLPKGLERHGITWSPEFVLPEKKDLCINFNPYVFFLKT